MRRCDFSAALRLWVIGFAAGCFFMCLGSVCMGQAANDPFAAQIDSADAQPPAPADPMPVQNPPRSSFVRAMLAEIEEAGDDELSDNQREQRRRMLLAADEELYRSTGENARRLILHANRKRCSVQVGACGYRVQYFYYVRPGPCDNLRNDAAPINAAEHRHDPDSDGI